MESLALRSFILVSGGSGGIGRAIALALGRYGHTPVVAYNSNQSAAKETAQQTGGFAVQMDLRDAESIVTACARIEKTLVSRSGCLNGVILGASPLPCVLQFRRQTAAMLREQFEVNVVGPHLLLSTLIEQHLLKRRSGFVGAILSRALGDESTPCATQMSSYIIAKGAMKAMLDTCCVEHPWLRVCTISPGFTETAMLNAFEPRLLELIRESSSFSSPEEVATELLSALHP